MANLSKPIKIALSVLSVSLLTTALYVLYIVLIGMPKTQARNYYNEGVLSIQKGEIRAAIQDFQTAVNYWPESYIVTELHRLESLSD